MDSTGMMVLFPKINSCVMAYHLMRDVASVPTLSFIILASEFDYAIIKNSACKPW